jgi:hypothetical protein
MSIVNNKPGYQRCDKIAVKTVPFTTKRIRDLLDVDTTILEDGAILIYDQESDTFKSQTFNDGQFDGDVTIEGDLTVNGELTTIETVNLRVEDPLIKLAENNPDDLFSIGFYADYSEDGGATELKTGLFRNHVDGEYYFFEDLNNNIQNNVIETDGLNLASMNADTVTANELVGVIDGGSY